MHLPDFELKIHSLLIIVSYFGGQKLDKGAYVEVKVLGSVDSGASGKMIKIAFSYMSEFYSYLKIFHICLHLLHLLEGDNQAESFQKHRKTMYNNV